MERSSLSLTHTGLARAPFSTFEEGQELDPHETYLQEESYLLGLENGKFAWFLIVIAPSFPPSAWRIEYFWVGDPAASTVCCSGAHCSAERSRSRYFICYVMCP